MKLSKFSDLPWLRTHGDDKTAAIVQWLCSLFILVAPLVLIYSLDGKMWDRGWLTDPFVITTPWKWGLAVAWVLCYSQALVKSQWSGVND